MIRLQNLTAQRGKWQGQFNFELHKGEWLHVLGQSGEGKSSLLELIAGFLRPTGGKLWIGGKLIAGESPAERNISFMFQHNPLFEHLSVEQNLKLAMARSLSPKNLLKQFLEDWLKRFQLPLQILKQKPGEISSGEFSRIYLLWTLLQERPIWLLDEPFGPLDPELHDKMISLAYDLHKEHHLTTVCISHTPQDAFRYGDRLLMIKKGQVVALDSPEELGKRPKFPYIASLLDMGNIITIGQITYYVLPNYWEYLPNRVSTLQKPCFINIDPMRRIWLGTHWEVFPVQPGAPARLRLSQEIPRGVQAVCFDEQSAHRLVPNPC